MKYPECQMEVEKCERFKDIGDCETCLGEQVIALQNKVEILKSKLEPIKPCPFCGSKAEEGEDEYNIYIACIECDARIEGGFNETLLIKKAWNKRV